MTVNNKHVTYSTVYTERRVNLKSGILHCMAHKLVQSQHLCRLSQRCSSIRNVFLKPEKRSERKSNKSEEVVVIVVRRLISSRQ